MTEYAIDQALSGETSVADVEHDPAHPFQRATAEAPAQWSIEDILSTARLPEEVVLICLRRDLEAEYAQVLAELGRLVDAQGNVIEDDEAAVGDTSPVVRAGDLHDRAARLRDEMDKASWPARLRGMTTDQFVQFQAEHYPKKQGAPLVEYFARLIARCLIDPEMSVADVERLRGVLAPSAYTRLSQAAQRVNVGTVDAPKLPAFSVTREQQ